MANAYLFPQSTLLLFFVIPVPMWVGVTAFVGYDLYRSLGQSGGLIDSAGHVLVALFETLAFLFYIKVFKS